ncbi:hypothetical protein D3C72_1897460 [compost metagenome]
MQQVQVDAVGAQPPQAALARLHGAAAAGVERIDLADQEGLIAPPRQGLADHFLGLALAVHLGGIDQPQAQVQAQPQRGDLFGARGGRLAHVPRSHAERGDALAVGQGDLFHASDSRMAGLGAGGTQPH